jgi:hypothetical protein
MLFLLQDLPSPLLFASRHITTLKCQQVSKDKEQSATQEEVYYAPKETLEFSNIYKQKFK